MTVVDETVLGSPVTLRYELDRNGSPDDPARLVLKVRSYEGTALAIEEWTTGAAGADIIRDSEGRFHAEVTPGKVGHYAFRWEAFNGANQPIGAAEGDFIVRTIYR